LNKDLLSRHYLKLSKALEMSEETPALARPPAAKTFKRSYKKSTNGCQNCKSRKVKVSSAFVSGPFRVIRSRRKAHFEYRSFLQVNDREYPGMESFF
jgi:hypothetical protein